MIPTNSIISVEEVIARVKQDLRIGDTTEHDTGMEVLIREGLGSLNCISQLEKKQCTLKAYDNRMQLPPDLIKFIALRPKTFIVDEDADPDQRTNLLACSRFIYADTDFLRGCGCDIEGVRNFQYGFQINKGFIHFNSDFGVDEADIAYMGLWLDSEGKRVIFERFERALTAYACWKFTRTWAERYNQYIIDSYQREWVLQRDKLRGMDVKTDFDQNKAEISAIMRAWIVSPIVNY